MAVAGAYFNLKPAFQFAQRVRLVVPFLCSFYLLNRY